MISWETPRGRIRVARVAAELSPDTQKLVDEAVARGREGAARIRERAAERDSRAAKAA